MSNKKRTTKSSSRTAKKRVPKHVAAYIKKWGRKPDAADKRFYEREGRWPSKREFEFYDKFGRLPKRGELAKLTKQAKAEKAQKRSIASKRAWEKRKQKSPDVAKWERDRKALQAAQKEDIERAAAAGIRRPLRAHRWYDWFYISLSRMTIDEIHGLLIALKRRGVRAFRVEREVPVGDRGATDFIAPTGFTSTKFQFLPRLSENELRNGNAKTGWPSLQSMRVPGIDVMRYMIIDDVAVRDHFPPELRKQLLRKKRETRETIKNEDDQAFYIARGKKPNPYQMRKMREMRKAIDADLAEEEEESDDE